MDGSMMPTFLKFVGQIFLCMLIDDTLFYWSHRALHHPSIYRYIHKKHHMFKKPCAIATEYCHPVEDLVSNTLSTVLGPMILKSHSSVFFFYTCFKLLQSLDAHSGYNLPFSPFSVLDSMDCSPAHDFHHSHNVGNYGGFFVFWDWICSTDGRYEKYLIKNKDNAAYFNVVKGLERVG